MNLIDNGGANSQGSLGNGYYELFSYTGTAISDAAANAAFNTPPGKTYIFSNQTVGSVNELLVQISVLQLAWSGQVDGNWNTGTSNWVNGNAATTYQDGVIVSFGDTYPPSATAVTNSNVLIQSAGVAPQSVTFSNSTALGYTLSNTTPANGISGVSTTLTVNGAGTVTLNGANSYGGGTSISNGKVVLGNASALGATTGAVALNSGTLDLATDTSVNAYNLNVGGTARIVSDKATSSSAGITHALGALAIGATQLNVSGGANVSSGTAGLSFGTVTLSGAPTFNVTNPTNGGTTRLVLGAVNNGANTMTFIGNGNVGQTGLWGSGSGGVVIGPAFTGTFNLSQANSYSGGTTLNSGTLVVGNPNALGPLSSAVTINGGVVDLAIDTTVNAYNLSYNVPVNIYTDRATSGAGVAHALGGLTFGPGVTQFNALGGANVTSGVAGLSFTSALRWSARPHSISPIPPRAARRC